MDEVEGLLEIGPLGGRPRERSVAVVPELRPVDPSLRTDSGSGERCSLV